jgi:hypothetical protein
MIGFDLEVLAGVTDLVGRRHVPLSDEDRIGWMVQRPPHPIVGYEGPTSTEAMVHKPVSLLSFLSERAVGYMILLCVVNYRKDCLVSSEVTACL